MPKYFNKELAVPSKTQRDNVLYASTTCNTTSIAMIAEYFGVKSLDPNRQLEDIFTEELLKPSWLKKAQLYMGKEKVVARYIFELLHQLIEMYPKKIAHAELVDLTIDEMLDRIDEGCPIMIIGDFPVPKGTIGHYNVLIGYDENGAILVLNDPWGDPNTKYVNTNGARVRISKEDAQKWFRGGAKKTCLVVYGVIQPQ